MNTLSQIEKAKHQFENIAFRPSVHLTIKQKITTISELDDEAGFYCSDWFHLSSHSGLLVCNLNLKLKVSKFSNLVTLCLI